MYFYSGQWCNLSPALTSDIPLRLVVALSHLSELLQDLEEIEGNIITNLNSEPNVKSDKDADPESHVKNMAGLLIEEMRKKGVIFDQKTA